MTDIVPTVVPATFEDILAAKERYQALASILHVDAADGVFAPNRTWLPLSGEKFPDAAAFFYEAHLMVENPLSLGVSFIRAGARRVIGHIEAFDNAERAREAFKMWRTAGAEDVGVSLLLATPLSDLAPYVPLIDFVQVMTIAKIGEQGQPFNARGLERVRDIHARYPELVIAVDGGVSEETIGELARAGATRFCIGAALGKAKDPAKTHAKLLAALAQ